MRKAMVEKTFNAQRLTSNAQLWGAHAPSRAGDGASPSRTFFGHGAPVVIVRNGLTRGRVKQHARRVCSPELSDRGDRLELNCDRRRQRADLNRGARWIGLARPRKIFGVEPVVDWKILFHVRKKDRDIDDVLPCRPGVFQDKAYVFERRAALRFDVVTDDVALRIERDAGNFFGAAFARCNAREKQQVAY